MARSSRKPTGAIGEAIKSLTKTKVLLVGIETYEYLEKLDGPSADIGFLEETLTTGSIALYD